LASPEPPKPDRYGRGNEPAVFTAFADDDYGGDMNNDATSTAPSPGSWKQILINETSANSSFENALIRYGGKWFNNTPLKAAVAVDGTDVSFLNTIVEYSGRHGIYLKTSSSTVANSTFRNNSSESDASGVYIDGGAPTVIGSTLENNKYGMYVVNSPSASVSSNTFTDNETEAVHVAGVVGSFSLNTGSGNTLNAIIIGGNAPITAVGTTTLSANALPYLLVNNGQVIANSTLAFENGVVVKGHDSNQSKTGKIVVKSDGRLFHGSSGAGDLVFTSMHDDTVGGAIDTATTSPSAGDWHGIEVESGGILDVSGFILRYAGGRVTQNNTAGIKIEGGSGSIRNALFEKNFQNSIRFDEVSSFTIANTTFRDHTEEKTGKSTAVQIIDSTIALENIIFGNNNLDISAVGDSSATCENCGAPTTDPPDLLL